MNKQGPNGIEWTHFSWSPLTGCLGPDSKGPCSYCYAKRIAERFRGTKAFPRGFAPTWHPERLGEPLKVKTPSRVFAVSMGDAFGEWVWTTWLDQMLHTMRRAPQHRFLLLTKQPQNILLRLYTHDESVIGRALAEGESLPNLWLGCTLTGADGEQDPSLYMQELKEMGWHVFVSIEPLLGPVNPDWYSWTEWVILGALTKGAKSVKPKLDWFKQAFEMRAPVFVKSNLGAHFQNLARFQEYPSGLKVRDNEV
jgi:protein gp37